MLRNLFSDVHHRLEGMGKFGDISDVVLCGQCHGRFSSYFVPTVSFPSPDVTQRSALFRRSIPECFDLAISKE